LIQKLRDARKTIIYISHILADVLALADDIAVLRDGGLVSFGPKADCTIPRMITLMVGRPIEQLYPPRQSRPQSRVLLSAKALAATGIIRDVSFTLHSGEVLGVFGLMGSGRTELARILFGLEGHETGEIVVGDRPAATHSPRRSIRNGFAFVTEDRREEGLLMSSAIVDNITLAALPRFSVTPIEFIERDRMRHAAREMAEALSIRANSLDAPARSLSGGNQQKVVLAKWLMSRRRLHHG
jgi:ABC-type sugar transport system ATPase subunit